MHIPFVPTKADLVISLNNETVLTPPGLYACSDVYWLLDRWSEYVFGVHLGNSQEALSLYILEIFKCCMYAIPNLLTVLCKICVRAFGTNTYFI